MKKLRFRPLVAQQFRLVRQSVYLLVLLLSISLCGCAAQTNHYVPVKNNNKRESSLGFSITPPSGAGWFEKLKDESLYYLKTVNTNSYSIYTKATEIHLPNTDLDEDRFLQFVKRTSHLNPLAGDYRNISISYTRDPLLSPLCVRYVQKYEDHGNKNLKQDEFIKVRKNGLVCMNPDTLSDGVDMFYVESFLHSRASVNTSSYKEEGESFLSSLQFHPPTKKGG